MGLTSALHIGRSSLVVSQAAIQVAGNNMANAATKGYSRQVANLLPARGQRFGSNSFIGRGVLLESIGRQVNEAVRSRLRSAISDESAAQVDQDLLGQVEAVLGELSDSDLSTQLNAFFNSWSELANTPNDATARNLVIAEGETLSTFIQRQRNDLVDMRSQTEKLLRGDVLHADELLTRIAQVNEAISGAEQGRGEAGGLRDQRDILLSELSELMDTTIVEQPSGSVDVLVGSIPVVLGNQSRGIEVKVNNVDGKNEFTVNTKVDGTKLDVQFGTIGSRLAQRDSMIQPTIDDLDSITNALIYEVNRIHSQGQGLTGYTEVAGSMPFTPTQADLPLNDPDLDWPFTINNGSFEISLTNLASGQRETTVIHVDLDNVNDSGLPGFEDDDTLNDVIAKINNISGISAELDPEGRLRISSGSDRDVISFSNDSSGLLAAAGINTFFTGTNAGDIGIDSTIKGDPSHLAVGLNHIDGDNQAAVEIALLQDKPLSQLGDISVRDGWLATVSNIGVQGSAAAVRLQSATLVRQSVESQDMATSGVSLDEESMNLMTFQRQYQASARFVSVVDQLTQTLLNIV